MSDTHFLILLAASILIALLLLIGLLRKPRVELPPEVLAQLQRLEQQTQATRMEVAKNDGALDGMANQLQGFTQATSHSLETVRQTVDEKLAQAVAESRTGRTELLAAFAAFEAQLTQRLTALDAAQSLALSSFRTELTGTLGTMSGALRDQLEGNGYQIKNQFSVLQDAVSQQLTGWCRAASTTPSSCAPRSTSGSPPSRPTTPPSSKKCAAPWTKSCTPRWSSAWASRSSWSATGWSRCTRAWARCRPWRAAWAT
jgi:hypothetical protein